MEKQIEDALKVVERRLYSHLTGWWQQSERLEVDRELRALRAAIDEKSNSSDQIPDGVRGGD